MDGHGSHVDSVRYSGTVAILLQWTGVVVPEQHGRFCLLMAPYCRQLVYVGLFRREWISVDWGLGCS